MFSYIGRLICGFNGRLAHFGYFMSKTTKVSMKQIGAKHCRCYLKVSKDFGNDIHYNESVLNMWVSFQSSIASCIKTIDADFK